MMKARTIGSTERSALVPLSECTDTQEERAARVAKARRANELDIYDGQAIEDGSPRILVMMRMRTFDVLHALTLEDAEAVAKRMLDAIDTLRWEACHREEAG